MALPLGIALQLVQEGAEVGRHRLLAGVAAREGEIALEHAAHLVDVLLEGLDLGRLLDDGERQLEARQDGAQVVADAVQHGGALLDGALDAPLHLDEGVAGLAHLARAARPELDVAALAEALRRLGEAQDRPDLVAQEQDGDAEQHQRGADHPEEEDVRVRRVGLAAPRDHAHDAFVELDADLDEVRAADRVGPERPCRPGGAARRRALRRGCEKNGFGPGGGRSVSRRMSTSRPRRSAAMRARVAACRRPAGSSRRCRSARRCRRSRPRTAAASPAPSAAP